MTEATMWNWGSLLVAMPELFLALSGLVLLVMGAFLKREGSTIMSWAVLSMFAVTMFLLLHMDWDRVTTFSGHFVMDRYSGYMKLLVLIGLCGSLLLSIRTLALENMARFEYPLLVLLSGLGMLIMLSANSFLSVYVGLELQSLSLYVLAALRRDHARASEAGLKYFVLGALASGLLLFGISLVYGYVGSIGFDAIGKTLTELHAEGTVAPGAIIGMVFILVGIAFKVSAVPFHMWTPDVYEGAPMPVTAFFAIVPKVAALGLLMRILFDPFEALMPDWQQVVWALSAASMTFAAFAGLIQGNIKRLLAYSSIGNVGYALIGVVAGTSSGAGAVILYLTIYMIMTAATFGAVMMLRRNDMAVERIADFSGLSRSNPALAYALAIMMFSMSGIPPLAGFFGKLVIFQTAIESGFYVLAVLGVLTSVVAAYYYLRVIKVMFFDEAGDPFDQQPTFVKKAVVAFCTVFVLVFVFIPDTLLQTSRAAASALFAVAGGS